MKTYAQYRLYLTTYNVAITEPVIRGGCELIKAPKFVAEVSNGRIAQGAKVYKQYVCVPDSEEGESMMDELQVKLGDKLIHTKFDAYVQM